MQATARLWLAPLDEALLDAFHAIATDPHVVRYLMDGRTPPREWSAAQLASSAASFTRHGVGIWIAGLRDGMSRDSTAVGFCGFLSLPDTGLDLELVYALRETHAGRGLGTELARTAIERARSAGLASLGASVDAVNVASVRILERLGFDLVERREGAFGDLRVYRLGLRPPEACRR